MSKSAIEYAEEQLGVPYVFGAEDPGTAFDCSGLVQYAYRQAGYRLPRTANQQYHATQRISYKDARPGDLVFFLDDNGHAYHTGIYLGNGEFLEAPHTGSKVKIAHVNVNNVVFGRVPGVKGTAGAEKAATVASNPDDYVSYGYAQALAASVPDIAKAIKLATAQVPPWSPQRFQDYLETTDWWKKNSDTAKKFIAEQAQDPTQYKQDLKNSAEHVSAMAKELGVTLTPAQINSLSTAALFQGEDDDYLRGQIGAMYKTGAGAGVAGGTSVQLSQQIQALAGQYGVPVTQSWVDNQVRTALGNGTGVEGATQQLMNMAASTYPSLAKQIQAGETVQQIAQPYIATMSQVLEIPDTSITLQDPTIKKALQARTMQPTSAAPGAGTVSPQGQKVSVGKLKLPGALGAAAAPAPEATPLWQFEDQLRQDPRWEKTDNAKASAYSMLAGLGKDFGFAS